MKKYNRQQRGHRIFQDDLTTLLLKKFILEYRKEYNTIPPHKGETVNIRP